MPPRAAVVVTGDEVLRGGVTDLNGAFLAYELEQAGVGVDRVEILPDDRASIRAAVEADIAAGFDLIITTGGLGGTHDDVTMSAVASACERELELRPDALEIVNARYSAFGRPDGVSARTQKLLEEKLASLPEDSVMIDPAGTAPGCAMYSGSSLVVVLPGPPAEVHRMWEDAHQREPIAGVLLRGAPKAKRTIRLFATVESQFMEAFDQIAPETLEGMDVGVCARDGELEVTIAAPDVDLIDTVQEALGQRFGTLMYSTDGANVIETVTALLRSRGETAAVAESCTGGGLGALLTSEGGASEVFLGGVIAYGNGVKEAALGVPSEVIVTHGAVSLEAAGAMAEGAIRATGADWGVSVTGIAGPGGGSESKPVGLVYVGVVGPGTDAVEELRLRGGRQQIRDRASARALHRLRGALVDANG